MAPPLQDSALAQLFTDARTFNEWTETAVPETLIKQLYELLRWGPTSANTSPARFVWIRSTEAKEKLASLAMDSNQAKIRAAAVTVIVGYDLHFFEALPTLFPARGEMLKPFFSNPTIAEPTAFRNGTLQGAYMLIAARALGLDCGPMSGFDHAAVDQAFFAGTHVKSNFICSLGYGKPGTPYPRNPRLDFEQANRFA